MKLNPSLLQHPQIPKALHSTNPRLIMGKERWDETRAKIFYEQNFKCKACGVHKNDARYHKRLECHESYLINYETGEVKLIELVGLCISCHKFIHNGLLEVQYKLGKISQEMYEDIMKHGMKVLKDAGLEPNVMTQIQWYYHTSSLSDEDIFMLLSENQKKQLAELLIKVPWEKWHLVFEGKKYYSKFKNIEEWNKFYSR